MGLKAYVFQESLNWHSLRNDFEPFFFVLLAPVSLGNKNGCKCQHYDYAQARRKRWAGGALAPQFRADQFTLSRPGWAHYPQSLLLAPPYFQTLQRPRCLRLCQFKISWNTLAFNLKFFTPQIQILFPNKYLGIGYKGLVWLMKNIDKELTQA